MDKICTTQYSAIFSRNSFFLWLIVVCLISNSWQCRTVVGLEYNQTWEDAFEFLGISWNPDGTLHREIRIPEVPPTPSANGVDPPPIALSSDQDPMLGSKLRIYIPVDPPAGQKLPVIVYFHGGGFIRFSPATATYHNFCNDITAQLPALVISYDYLLSPENRIPEPHHKSVEFLSWLMIQPLLDADHSWMNAYADYSRVYVMGSSAGANIALGFANNAAWQGPPDMQIRGLIMNQPYFGGVERTPLEIRLMDDPHFPLYVNDVLWNLSLPEWTDRDYWYCNVLSQDFIIFPFRVPKVYVKSDYGDPLVDKSLHLVQKLKEAGVPVSLRINSGGFHEVELHNKTAAQQLYNDIKFFINEDAEVVGDITKISVPHQAL